MKKFALALIASSFAVGAAAPALADSNNDRYVDTAIVDVAPGQLELANGMKLDQDIEYFAMPQAAAGDKVRIIFTDTNELKQVRVIR
ncbi:hypothetical protein ABWH92_06210 [Ahrensia marina]|uniref:hypothetical protein n=1 Tax=Ahrensia marina TaxID=1514904 RepID=UPI0035CEF70A